VIDRAVFTSAEDPAIQLSYATVRCSRGCNFGTSTSAGADSGN
jgi:hypothetical protein